MQNSWTFCSGSCPLHLTLLIITMLLYGPLTFSQFLSSYIFPWWRSVGDCDWQISLTQEIKWRCELLLRCFSLHHWTFWPVWPGCFSMLQKLLRLISLIHSKHKWSVMGTTVRIRVKIGNLLTCYQIHLCGAVNVCKHSHALNMCIWLSSQQRHWAHTDYN